MKDEKSTISIEEALSYFDFSPEDLTIEKLNCRYREMAKKSHPDKAGGSDEEFQTLTNANTRLKRALDSSLSLEKQMLAERCVKITTITPAHAA